MSALVRRAENAKTIIFPTTVKEAKIGTFSNEREKTDALESVILNEGLEKLGECKRGNTNHYEGVFCQSQIKRITLPSTLRILGDFTFEDCEHLSQITSRRKTPTAVDNDEL